MFIFALLGMELFAYTLFYNVEEEMIIGQENIYAEVEKGTLLIDPVLNFNSIGRAIMCIFALFIGDDWPNKAAEYIRASREDGAMAEVMAYTYFLLTMVTLHVIMQGLLTALLLKNFEKSIKGESDSLEKDRQRTLQRLHEFSETKSERFEPDKSVCSGKIWKKRWDNFALTFNRVFTGNSAAFERDL